MKNEPRPMPTPPTVTDERVRAAQIVSSEAARWASNMIVETTGNYGRYLTAEQRQALKDASAALARFQHLPRPAGHEDLP